MSDDKEEMITQPMIEAVLERLQLLETRLEDKLLQTSAQQEQLIGGLRDEIGGLRGEIGGLRAELGGLRAEMNENFIRVRDEIAILNDDTLKTRAGQRELFRRMEQLESKAS